MSYNVWSVAAFEIPSAAKWNLLGTNDAAFADGSGVTGAWTSFTPTLSNFTLGTGSKSGKYNSIGKTVTGRLKVTLGGSSVVAGALALTLPVTINSDYDPLAPIGYGGVYDASGTIVYFVTLRADGTIGAVRASGTYSDIVDTSTLIPITFATGDKILISFKYESA